MISEKTIYSLEFNKIREILKGFAVSQSGKKSILSMMPAEGINTEIGRASCRERV